MDLQVTVEQKASEAYVVSPSGIINSLTAPLFEEKLDGILQKTPSLIAMDLAELTYISSAGIRVLIKTQKALNKTDGKLMFMHLQPQIRKVFEIINALPSMKIFASMEEMDEYLDTMQKAVTGERDKS